MITKAGDDFEYKLFSNPLGMTTTKIFGPIIEAHNSLNIATKKAELRHRPNATIIHNFLTIANKYIFL